MEEKLKSLVVCFTGSSGTLGIVEHLVEWEAIRFDPRKGRAAPILWVRILHWSGHLP